MGKILVSGPGAISTQSSAPLKAVCGTAVDANVPKKDTTSKVKSECVTTLAEKSKFGSLIEEISVFCKCNWQS